MHTTQYYITIKDKRNLRTQMSFEYTIKGKLQVTKKHV